MTKLEKAKEIIKEYYKEGDCGIYNSHNHSYSRDSWDYCPHCGATMAK